MTQGKLTVREITQARRERIARRVFELEAVKAKIDAMAQEGFSQLLLSDEHCHGKSLKGTDAATDLEDFLLAAGCHVDWVPKRVPAGSKGNKTGYDIICEEMLVAWGGADTRLCPPIGPAFMAPADEDEFVLAG